MNLSRFLHYNHHCPICNEPLTLYMQWVSSICFKGTQVESNLYQFKPFKGTNKDMQTDDLWMEHVLLLDKGDDIETQMSSNKLMGESKKFQIYFFYLCNPGGFKDKSWGDYEINLYRGCYYRSTPFLEYQRNDDQEGKKWTLEVTNPEQQELINKDESFSVKHRTEALERVYMLNLDYERKETTLWHYSATEEDRKKDNFKPKLFEKQMPLLKNPPKVGLEDREKLLDRFDSWIIMS